MTPEPPEALPGEPAERSRAIVERKIRELMEQGFFDDLPGAGKPLDLSEDDNPFVPPDMRLAYRILRNAGVAPPWIELGSEVEGDLEALRRRAVTHRERLRVGVARTRRAPSAARPALYERLRAEHAAFLDEYAAAVDEANRKVDRFNQTVPVYWLQKARVSRQRALDELAEALPPELRRG